MDTPEIKGFFSKEHSVLVFLICVCFAGLLQNYRTQQKLLLQMADIKADIKILTFKLNNGETHKNLATLDLYRHKGKPKFQTANPFLACNYRNKWEFLQYAN